MSLIANKLFYNSHLLLEFYLFYVQSNNIKQSAVSYKFNMEGQRSRGSNSSGGSSGGSGKKIVVIHIGLDLQKSERLVVAKKQYGG